MLTITPKINTNNNFKAKPSNNATLKRLANEIAAITAEEVVIPERINSTFSNSNKMLSLLTKLSFVPLVSALTNHYIAKINKRLEQEAKAKRLEEEAMQTAKRLEEEAMQTDSKGRTKAYRLLEEGYIQSFKNLVEKHPNVLLIRINGWSCLMEAASCGRGVVDYIVEQLIKNPDYNPNEQLNETRTLRGGICGSKGDTDALVLARFGYYGALEKLASHPGINLAIKNSNGKTCFDVALENRNYKTVNMLTQIM